jgi:hypothetical protein
MIEPSSGRARTSGPGTPLLLGIVATGALLLAFLIGFRLGSGEDRVRTIIVGASERPAGSGQVAEPTQPDRIQPPRVDSELQQAYYANLRLGSWVVCSDGPSLRCQPAKYVPVDGDRGFQLPETYVTDLSMATVPDDARVYAVGDLEHAWIGAVDGPEPRHWIRLLGVSLNGSVQFLDLGELAPGRYVVIDRSQNDFTQQGSVTRAIALTVKPNA